MDLIIYYHGQNQTITSAGLQDIIFMLMIIYWEENEKKDTKLLPEQEACSHYKREVQPAQNNYTNETEDVVS